MATATQALKNFIDGESVDAAEGATDAVLNPATGEEIAQAPSSTRADVDRAVTAARAAVETVGNEHPGRARARHPQAGRRPRGQRRGDRRARVGQRGQADQAFQDDEIPAMVDNLRFFAGAARNLEGSPPASTSRATPR